MKNSIMLFLKLVVLTIILFICFLFGSTVSGLTKSGGNTDPNAASILLLVCAIDTAIISFPIIRSKWSGWRLVLAIFAIFFGVMTLLSQIESLVFLKYLVSIISLDFIKQVFIQGLIVTLTFSPIAVLVLGKMKNKNETWEPGEALAMPWREWVWKLVLISIVYVGIYMFFGQFVFLPLAGEAFYQFYHDLKMPIWILPFQAIRGIIWTLLAIPILRMMKGKWWESGLAVALLFSLLMGDLLLLPNPIMPDPIRKGHLVELITSNFVFGWAVAWLFNRRHDSPLKLLKR